MNIAQICVDQIEPKTNCKIFNKMMDERGDQRGQILYSRAYRALQL